MQKTISDKEIEKAVVCLKKCPICKAARKKQSGFVYWFVKSVEGGTCPNCKAYAKVYGRKAHEPIA